MSVIHEWAAAWQVPAACVSDLLARLGVGYDSPLPRLAPGMLEAGVSSRVRLEAAQNGVLLFRNNVGACMTDTGRLIRYGLCNDSDKLNESIKSGDLIGVNPVTVTPAHVGTVIGQFVSREVKAADWVYTGTLREKAQLKWANIVNSKGGDARFVTGLGSFS